MLRTRAAIGLALAASLASAGAGCGDDGLGPTGSGVITLSEDGWDFGDVPIGQLVEHTFTISNEGTGPLRLAEGVDVEALEGC